MHRSKNWFALTLVAAALATMLATAPAAQAAATPPPSAKPADAAAPVDLNTAGVEQLLEVPGIGKSLAQRIVTYREKNGAFAKVDDLLKVQGIGEKSIEKLRPYLTAGRAAK